MNTFFLANTPLFHGIKEVEISEMLHCLNAREKKYKKDEIIFRAGTSVSEIGLVESGSVNIVVNFYWGNSHIFGHVGKGQVFAENYAAIPGQELVCDVVASEDTEVLFLSMNKMLTTCQRGCAFHSLIIHNMLRISAQKNLNMSSRMMHTASKSLRDRLLSYLSEQDSHSRYTNSRRRHMRHHNSYMYSSHRRSQYSRYSRHRSQYSHSRHMNSLFTKSLPLQTASESW